MVNWTSILEFTETLQMARVMCVYTSRGAGRTGLLMRLWFIALSLRLNDDNKES